MYIRQCTMLSWATERNRSLFIKPIYISHARIAHFVSSNFFFFLLLWDGCINTPAISMQSFFFFFDGVNSLSVSFYDQKRWIACADKSIVRLKYVSFSKDLIWNYDLHAKSLVIKFIFIMKMNVLHMVRNRTIKIMLNRRK